MKTTSKISSSFITQAWHFFLHLRWHYQLFILSGGFLLGGFLSGVMNPSQFFIQFLNVHLLLFGGATAYNSYWDKDEGPIGGLKNPPKMTPWMLPASLLLQVIGLLLAFYGSLYAGIYLFSILLFWLYSTPLVRWKGYPIKSLFAIGLSTGFNAVLMGYLAAGNSLPSAAALAAAFGVALILLSLYPLSQIYQQDEDKRRGDRTFVLQYGILFVKRFFKISFFSGLLTTTGAIMILHPFAGAFFGLMGLITGFVIRLRLKNISGRQEGYTKVMRIKYGTSLAFVSFLVVALFLKFGSFR